MNKALNNRYDILYIFDVINGNPNGDPDNANAPRMDFETQKGWVSDVMLKRKIRNYITLKRDAGEAPSDGFDIYVKERAILNKQHEKAYTAKGLSLDGKKAAEKNEIIDEAREWMCQNFFDIRMFGAVMTTGTNCGQVRGPVQFTFAESVDPISPQTQTVTRMAVTTEKEAEKQDGSNRTLGKKDIVPYGLYKGNAYISAPLAAQTGFSEEDLEILLESLENMFDHDRSAARGSMAPRGLIVFKHPNKLGNAPSHKLLEEVKVEKKEGVVVPRSFADYTVTIPEGLKSFCKEKNIEIIERV